jgi:hypothetical protein
MHKKNSYNVIIYKHAHMQLTHTADVAAPHAPTASSYTSIFTALASAVGALHVTPTVVAVAFTAVNDVTAGACGVGTMGPMTAHGGASGVTMNV